MTLEDMCGPLEYIACHSCYNTIAMKRDLYLINSMKQSIHNEAINMIMFYTSDKRKRLSALEKLHLAPLKLVMVWEGVVPNSLIENSRIKLFPLLQSGMTGKKGIY